MKDFLVARAMECGALAMISVAIGVVAYLAIMGSEQAEGSMISVVAAGVGFYLRGRVQSPTS